MQRALIKITAVFIIVTFAVLLTGCLSNPSINNSNTVNSLNSSEASVNAEKQDSSSAGNPGDSGSSTTVENAEDTTSSGSSTDVDADGDDISSDSTQDKEDTSTTSAKESGSAQDSINTIPELSLEIIEGPVVLEDNSLCYYRIKADVKGSPEPKLFFSKDDSNGAWGSNIVQINLIPEESYELTVKATNSSGQANASIILNWQAGSIQAGQTKIVSEEANPGNYFIEVSLNEQKVRVFYKNSLLREMVCSTGAPLTPTPKGTFKTSDKIKYAWLAKYNVGAYYFVRFYGSYLFHSTPFDKEGNLIEAEQQNLGKPVSHGCVRLDLNEEKWLYETIPSGVSVKIY